jgi:site-specific DNA recombinase
LKEVNVIARNARSQLARARDLDMDRETALREKIAAAQRKADGLRESIARGERLRLDEDTVRQRLGNFEEIWKTMTIEEQARLLRTLIERVGYDARGEKVRVTYHSAGVREFCKGAA